MAEQSPQERRRFYRVVYPITLRPTLRMGVAQHSVLEISEAAIVLCCGNLWMFKLGQHIEGRITFINGETEWVSGKVVRLQTERVLIMLQPTMPTGRVYGEQLFLRQHRG